MSGGNPAYRIDGKAADAAAFYAAACDPQRSIAVEACAGAGKTWMLVSRILRALLAGTEPAQILAITFTRKAAGEMRQRLDEWLLGYSEGHSDRAARLQALLERGASPEQAQALEPVLGRLLEQLLKSGRGVEVRTFHAWFGQLLAHAPLALLHRLDLPAAFETIEDTSVLADELFRRFHTVVQADAGLRADYLALVARHRRGTVLQWLHAAWRRAPELQRADAAGTAQGSVPAAWALWPECQGLSDPAALLHRAPLADEIDALARQLGASGKARAQAAAAGLRAALEATDAATAFECAWQALFTEKDEPRKQLGDSPAQQAMIEALLRLRGMRLQQQAHEDHRAMLGLARVLLHEHVRLKRDRGLVDMADLERVAEALLGDSDVAGWVQERLDQRLRHVLIDEFQDTSPLQWQLLHSWLSSYAGAGGGASGQRPLAVFIVGDPKQSIYRFRGAEPRVFEAACDFVVQGLSGRLLQCDHTRRNAPAVIEAINAVFDEAARLDDWGSYRPHTTASDAAGAVLRLPGVPRSARAGKGAAPSWVWRDSLTEPRDEPEVHLRAEEARQVAAAVSALVFGQGLAPGEVMVLARKRSVLAWVADALAQQDLAHVVAEPLALHESPEALDLVAVLDVLASPGHDLALARALRSPIFGADDSDLLWLADGVRSAGGAAAWLPTLLAADALPSSALARAQALLQAWSGAAAVLPPHDLLDRIVHDADLMARLIAAVPPARRGAAVRAVRALLAAALEQGGGRYASIYGFVRDLRAGRLPADPAAPADAVQLLTVHGAKGLEARAVVIVDADPEPRPLERATVLVDWPIDDAAPRRIAFLRSESAVPPSLASLWEAESAAREREELNGLYVAMTRARQCLVFSRTEPSRRTGPRAWWARAEAHAAPWHIAPRRVEADARPRHADVPVLPAWLGPAQPRIAASVAAPAMENGPGLAGDPASGSAARLPSGPAADPAAARLGQAVHRVLEWAGRPGAALPREERAAACAAAAATFGLRPGGADEVLRIATRILDSRAAAAFFRGPGLEWAGAEVPLAAGGELLRIDRLVALRSGTGLTWWVLDYKLHGAPLEVPAHREQLRRYVAAVRDLQPGDAVRGAFITGRGEVVEI